MLWTRLMIATELVALACIGWWVYVHLFTN